MKRHPLVVIHWRDAIGDRHLEIAPPHCLSVGWLVEKNRSHVRVAAEILEDGSYCEITTIPRGMLVEVTPVEFPLPEAFDKVKRLSNKEE